MKNKRRCGVMAILLVVALLVSVFGTATVAQAQTKAEAIEDGLTWLAAQQDPDTGGWLGYYAVYSTAIAVTKLAEHAKVTQVPPIDPFDPAYEYSDNIVKGLQYLFENAYSIAISPQPAGDPDVNLVNGQGIYFASDFGSHILYETGGVMMALQACCHPERVVDAPGSPVDGWTYLDVMKDCVDYVAFAQQDTGSGRGGWRYYHNYGSSDNSVSQWPVLGLLAAAAPGWGIHAPSWVKTELLDWLAYSQNAAGYFGYSGPSGGSPIAMTSAGLIQLTYCGVPTTDPRWDNARNWIGNNWQAVSCYYDMYGLMKAAMILEDPIWFFGEHEWQAEYDEWLINNQSANGSWGPGCRGYTTVLATCWALLILQKAAPPPLFYLTLAPDIATNPVGTSHTLTAMLVDEEGRPIPDVEVTFTVTEGPHAGATGTDTTDADGKATWSYTGTSPDTDTIVATTAEQTSNEAFKTWVGDGPPPPKVPGITGWGTIATVLALGGLMLVVVRRRGLAGAK